jgi:hypothetical protein
MLAARGEPQFFRRAGTQLQHPSGQPLPVDEFARMRRAVDGFGIRVARILLVETAQGGFETLR